MNEKYDDTVYKKREFYLLKLKYASNWRQLKKCIQLASFSSNQLSIIAKDEILLRNSII